MFEGLNRITLSGEKYPIKCDLLVLEKIQEEFGTINDFEKLILNWESIKIDGEEQKKAKLPSAKAVNFSLPLMINEGIEIENELTEQKRPLVNRKEIIRKVDMRLTDIASLLHDEFAQCFKTKNAETTQNQTE